ncbi:sensor domain-containing diguanylate cyclase, partial [bacterium]|nr:sensor domain-containing diguanylate cyclase [bacterium]
MKLEPAGLADSTDQLASYSAKSLSDPSQIEKENQQLRKHVYQLRNLVKVSLEATSILNEQELIHSYIMNLFGLLSIKSIVVMTNSTDFSGDFVPVQYRGVKKQDVARLKVSQSDKVLALFDQHRPNVLPIAPENGLFDAAFSRKVSALGGHLVAPILQGSQTLGLAIIGEKHNSQLFTDTEIEIITGLTNFLGIGILNARLYKEKEQMSLTDPLTGLYNRRHLETRLQNEIARARRFHHPLSLVLLDVDDFKNYNDRLGHLSGDLLLKNLADVLTNTVRCSDTIARYGGEEFCIILPELAETEALRFSERIRKVIFSHPFEKREIQPKGHVTISLGTATFPNDANYKK